ncbi:hypothetical protein MMC11_008337 [Xylographa trunciseda]|nr:hypothetical protein [Xylographa trunciseda]
MFFVPAASQATNPIFLLLVALVLLSLYFFGFAIYNLYFHPLSKFNGPPLWCATRLGFITSLVRGNLVADVWKLHEQYGDIVRLAPNELSFAKEEAWNDLFLHRPGHKPFLRNPIFFKAPPGQPENLVTTTDGVDGARMRKLIAPAFTEQAMMKQEPTVQSYLNLLIRQLEGVIDYPKNGGTAVVNIVNWYNFYTFDVIGDLGLGEAFQCLENTNYHPWVAMIFQYLKGMTLLAATRFYPLLHHTLLTLVPPSIRRMQRAHYAVALDKIHRRMNLEKPRADFMTPVLAHNPNYSRMSLEEIESTFALLIVAGSETTATVLSGVTNELLKAPAQLRRLEAEVRGAFARADDITFAAAKALPFLNAVCSEGLRMCNPVPAGLPRVVPDGGESVCGHFLPGGTNLSVHPTALSFSPANFARPTSFLPERFLPAAQRPAEFAQDRRATQQPFGLGPRACIGKGLALAQLRCVLARMVWGFEMQVVGEGREWMAQKTFIVVQKEEVWVRLRRRRGVGEGEGESEGR